MSFPSIPRDLALALDLAFPLRSPEPEDSLAEIMYRAGQRSVVEALLTKLDAQQKDSGPEQDEPAPAEEDPRDSHLR